MLLQKTVSFVHGAVLTKDMLGELYQYPRDFVKLKYDSYSDGILEGIDFVVHEGNVCITRGLIKFQGEYYFLLQPVNLTVYLQGKSLQDKQYNLYLQRSEKKYADHITEKSLEIYISEDTETDMFLLFRFWGTDMRLPTVRSQEDMVKSTKKSRFWEFDNPLYVDFRDTVYAMPEKGTFHPFLFRAVRKYLKEKENKSTIEWGLLLQLQNNSILAVETMRTYLDYIGQVNEVKSRNELFCEFIQAIEKKHSFPDKKEDIKHVHSFGGIR